MNVRIEAYKIIQKVLSKNIFSDKLLKHMTKKLKAADKNAHLLYFLVKGVIKMHKNLEYIASLHTDDKKYAKTDKNVKYLIYLGLYQMIYSDNIPDYAAINETVEIAKKKFNKGIAHFVNAVLRSYQRKPELSYPKDKVKNLAYKYSFKEDQIKTWLSYWGEENTTTLCKYFNQVPKLHIRVNNLKTNIEEIIKYFNDNKISFKKSDLVSNILISDEARKILNCSAFQDGLFSIQDSSAALVVELMSPQIDESILDLFAAPGGKSTYCAEIMENSGEIISVDKFPYKIKKLKKSVHKLGLRNIQMNAIDAFEFGPVAPAYDRVLLDVPCTGWGVFQRKSELRWQAHQKIKELQKIQRHALSRGAKFVRPGGFLIYSTCTLNRRENEDMIEYFLEKHKDFKLVPAENYIPRKCTANGYLKTLPFKDNMDGAFAAKLQKDKGV